MRRTQALAVLVGLVSGIVLPVVPAAFAQTGYPPGLCTAVSGTQNEGPVSVGQRFVLRVTPTCLFTPGTPVTLTVNGVDIPGKIAEAGGFVLVDVSVVSVNQLSIDDSVLTPAICGTNTVTAQGASSPAQGGISTQTATFTLNCPASTSTTAPASTTTIARPPPLPSGTATLAAVTEAGTAKGPAGAGLTLSGSGFPTGGGQAASQMFAAPRLLGQEPPACKTVYFFFDGQRIGTGRPDAAGNVRRSGLSVPGGVDPGAYPVTAACRSAGTPPVASTTFEVTESSVHRSAFVTALPRTDHVDFSPERLLLSAFAALGLLMLIAFPAELFNSTLEANYDEVRGWFRLRPRRPGAGTGVRNVLVFILFLVISGPLWFSMQSSSELDLATTLGALGLSLATAVVVLSSDLPTFVHLRRRYGERANVVALPGSLIVALASIGLSRAIGFEPGYFYGLVGGLAFSRQLRRDVNGRLAALAALILVALSIATWALMTPVSRMADGPTPGILPVLTEGFLGGVFWAALDSLVIALLPLTLLNGSKITGWSRAIWAALYAVTLFAFIHILLNPGTGYVADTSRSPFAVIVGLFLAFSLSSFAFWAYFRFRSPRPSGQAPVAA